MKTVNLLNVLCDKEGKLIHVRGERDNDAFRITEAECRRQTEKQQAKKRRDEAERRRQNEKRAEKQAALKSEQAMLREELSNLKGLFTGRRRREIEARLAVLEQKIKSCVL